MTATHVYANGLEIACAATDGVASTAFPDPCWSPPGPKGGPVLVSYPNTAYARDIVNGTATVFIAGSTVAIEDKAYFSTSTGNEPATTRYRKGDKTGVIKGKAYFQSWSFDVIFEGLGVDRHTDLVSHNHGSMPGNTPLFPYLSREDLHKCGREIKKVVRSCDKQSEQSDERKELRSKSKIGTLLQRMRGDKSGKGRRDEKGWHWTDDHCDGLQVKLRGADEALPYAKQLEEVYKHCPVSSRSSAGWKPN